MKYDNLPQVLKEYKYFCLWKYGKRKNGKKPDKIRYQTNGFNVRVNNMNTFTTLENVLKVVSNFDGIGIGIFDVVSAIDIDGCIDEDGNLSEMAKDIISIFKNCYIEKSPSGRGIRIIFLIKDFNYDKAKYYINNQKIGVEVYVAGTTKKFLTVTGDVTNVADLVYAEDELQIILDKYMKRTIAPKSKDTAPAFSYLTDEEVIGKASKAANGELFVSLMNGDISKYKSPSEADIAISNILAFWCGRDTEQMDRLFRQSNLMRDKWDREQSGTTYGNITLTKAIEGVTSTYSPYIAPPTDEDFGMDLNEIKPFSNGKYLCTDIGNSNLFADYYKNLARYVPERKQWFVFDGKAWLSRQFKGYEFV